MSRVLYLKLEQCTQVPEQNVTIGDVATLECTDQAVVNRLKTEKLVRVSSNPYEQTVVSVMAVIQKIHEIYPELEVQNLGESDFIVSLRPGKQSKVLEYFKVFCVCLVSFLGSVFSIMTFNEDVSVQDSFTKVYEWVMGYEPQGFTVLEFTYSLGLGVGIIVFFNHIGKKRLTKEPSPVEVEMAGYDQDVYTTLIQHEGRKGKEKDVG